MSRHGRRRYGRPGIFESFYLNPSAQYSATVISAIVFAGFVFSGFLLFRYTDSADLIARGKRQMAEGKVAWAAKTFETLVANHRDSYEGHLLLGQAYLELGDRHKAELEFKQASGLKSPDIKDNDAQIAMSNILIARKQFIEAETSLLGVYRQNNNEDGIRKALYDLYDNWGDTLLQDDKDYAGAIAKYERAVRFVNEYRLEDNLKEKLIETITTYANKLDAAKDFDGAIHMLKKSLRYRYLPDTLIEIAASYERANHMDDAIDWYRKAYEVNPNIISIKLSNILIQKGRLLLDQKQPELAEQYFKEARHVSESANVPMDVLYPVAVQNVQVSSRQDEATGEFLPQVSITIANRGSRPLNFLVAKATFYSGDNQIAEATEAVATPDKPLAEKNVKGSSRTLVLKPGAMLNLNNLVAQHIQVKVAVSYTESSQPSWKQMVMQDAELKAPVAASSTEKPL